MADPSPETVTGRPLTDPERGRARTHKLTDPVVVALLANYLHRELVNVHGVQHVSIGVLRDALLNYVRAVDTALDAERGLH